MKQKRGNDDEYNSKTKTEDKSDKKESNDSKKSEDKKDIKENYNCTMIIIAQRISSIKNCEHILVIDDGNPIAYGVHEELLKSVDIYQEIYASQMGGDDDEL